MFHKEVITIKSIMDDQTLDVKIFKMRI